MRLPALIAALIASLLGPADAAVAAANWVARMERQAACSWDRPGNNPFTGDVVAAIDRYSDIPTLVRIELKRRMQARQYDDLVDIRRDDISGRERYEPAIRDMHFGLDRVCRQVTRGRWTAQMHERGLVYCEQGHCILVPTVCRNVSRIERRPTLVAGAPAGQAPGEALAFAAPSIGPSATSSEGFSATPTPRGPEATSSFAEAVAGAVLPLWPADADGNAGTGGNADADPGFGTVPWSPTPGGGSGGGPPRDPDSAGGDGDSGGSAGNGDGGGSFLGGLPGGGAGGSGSGSGSGSVPVTAIPEPATWASLLAGLLTLAGVSARRKRRRRAAPH